MLSIEGITKVMEILKTQVGDITQTFLGVAIKSNNKDKTNKDHRVEDNSTINKTLEINKKA